MSVWKYFTLCRENEAAWVFRSCCILALGLWLQGCAIGPTPHPADSDPIADEEGAYSQAPSADASAGGEPPSVEPTVDSSSDALSEVQDAEADTSDAGPDVEDVLGDTASDAPSDTATDVPGDSTSDGSGDTVSQQPGDTASD